ncbi:hypothetical protein M758_1G259300 [Ceratodon purpureus]|nr:hypothetical protein M758_1G259300 [Ceratodon purpureus]
MVSARMTAVLAVALLLLCGNVHSAEEALAGYVTQVKTDEHNASSTAPAIAPATAPSTAPDTAPAITSPTGESGDTHTAVLSALVQDEKSDVVLVDLARADDENMGNMTSAPGPSSGDAIPEGFDMVEEEEPSKDEEAPGPDSADLAAPGPYSADSFAGEEHGTLVSDADDDKYPNISGDEDNSNKNGYGVQMATLDGSTQADSFSTADPSSSDDNQGTLVSDADDDRYPNISGDEDNSNKNGYGVQMATLDGSTQADSFSTYNADPSGSDDNQGTLVSDADDDRYPNISGDEDNSNKNGYGVQMATLDGSTQADSFSTADPSGSEDNQGTLVSDADDDRYPNISGDEDNSNKNGYGVQMATLDGSTQADSFSTYNADPSGSEDNQGTLVSDADDDRYPNISGDEDNSNKNGYGVQMATLDGSTQADSFSTYSADPAGSDGNQGILVSDVDDDSYPTITESQDFANGKGYGVNSPVKGDSVITQDEAGSGNGTTETTGVALQQSRTYTPPAKPMATWGKGKCTFYGGMDAAGTMSGACGYGNLYASGYGAYTAALSSALFKNGMACGACYEVACSGNAKSCKRGSVLVTITNFCPPNPGRSANNGGWCNGANQHFDLSYPAFAKIADPKAGVVDLNYRRVPCQKKGGIRFTLNGNCNFNIVTITNVGGSGVVTQAYMKGDGMDWAPMTRNWGANWQCSRNYCGKGISIKIVTSDKKVSVSRLADKTWAFGKTYIGQQVN